MKVTQNPKSNLWKFTRTYEFGVETSLISMLEEEVFFLDGYALGKVFLDFRVNLAALYVKIF